MRGLALALIAGLVAGLVAGLWSTEASAAERHRLAYSKKLGLEVLAADPGSGWCRETLVLEVFAEDETLFERDPFKVLVQKIGKVVERECPAARGAEINGYKVGGTEPIFGGTAPLVCTALIAITGWNLAPGLLLAVAPVYWLVMPTLFPEGPRFGMVDLTLFLGMGCLFDAVFLAQLRRHALLPLRDPRLPESLAFENF